TTGRTGIIVKVSDDEAVLRDNIYKNISFTKDVVKFPITNTSHFKSAFSKNRIVYYDLEVDGTGKAKCKCIWIGRKEELELNKSKAPLQLKLKENGIYETTVKRIRSPYAFIVEENVSKVPIFVCNQGFRPNSKSPKLKRDEPVICYVKEGDTVYMSVRHTPGKEFEWSGWDAWMKDSNEVSNVKSASMTHESNMLIGKLTHIFKKTGLIEKNVFFHRDNAFIYGVPLESIQLDKVFSQGDEIKYSLREHLGDEASCVWVGTFHKKSDDVTEMQKRISGLIKYCQDKGIHPKIQTALLQLDGKQQRTNETSKVNEKSKSQPAEQLNNLPPISLDPTVDFPNAAAVSVPECEGTEPLKDPLHINNVTSEKVDSISKTNSAEFINKEDKENRENCFESPILLESSAIGTDFIRKEERNCEYSNIASSSKNYSTEIVKEEDKERKIPPKSYFELPRSLECFTVETNSMEDEKYSLKNLLTEIHANRIGSNEGSNESSDMIFISSEGSTNSPELNINIVGQNKKCSESISSSESSLLLEGATSINPKRQFDALFINKTVASCLERSLLKILERTFPEDYEIVKADAMKFFKNELDQFVVHKLTTKTIRYILEHHFGKIMYTGNVRKRSQSSIFRSLVYVWKQETKRTLEEEKAKKIEEKMDSILTRAKHFQEKLNATFSNVELNDSDTDEYSDVDADDENDDCFKKCDDGEENRLVHIVQDFLNMQNDDSFRTVMQNNTGERRKLIVSIMKRRQLQLVMYYS
ncbi:hypothetical protein L9F63_008300, partial [Diploptera punctata]